MINRHPDSELLVEYTSGSLSTAPIIAVTTHLQFCENCRNTVHALEHLGGDLLDLAESVPISESLFGKVLSGIDENSGESDSARGVSKKSIDEIGHALPPYVQKLLPDGKLHWRFLSPALRVANISVGEGKYELALHRIKAGGKAPEHDHNGQEITVVLTGCFSDEDGIYQPGDFIVREQNDIHRPAASHNEECICLSVLAAPIRLTGAKRLLNNFLSFSPS